MSLNHSVQFHMRFVTEKHKELKESLITLISTLVGENIENKKQKSEVTLTKANDLKASISQQDAPHWLPSLIQGLQYFRSSSWNSNNLIDYLIKNRDVILNYKWV
ncbi:MAG: hypothetical protein JRG71_13860, partial [Deltaproteobacteria bacterium]|nr:hypothetical protein [Deltaproteobacteria bacterium]